MPSWPKTCKTDSLPLLPRSPKKKKLSPRKTAGIGSVVRSVMASDVIDLGGIVDPLTRVPGKACVSLSGFKKLTPLHRFTVW